MYRVEARKHATPCPTDRPNDGTTSSSCGGRPSGIGLLIRAYWPSAPIRSTAKPAISDLWLLVLVEKTAFPVPREPRGLHQQKKYTVFGNIVKH